MQVALIFPPLCDPRAPQLALPSLAAALRRAGVGVSMYDQNLRGIIDLCAPERLAEAHAALRQDPAPQQATELKRALCMIERLYEQAPHALRDLRNAAFFEPLRFASARKVIDSVIRVASLAVAGVDASLFPIDYKVRGINPARLNDLIAVTGRSDLDLFASTTEALLADLSRNRPTLAGITITNRQQIIPGLTLARRLRAAGHFVVIGGAVFSKFHDELRSRPEFFRAFADVLVVYEGETALLGLVETVARGGRLRDIPNLLFLEGGVVVATTVHVEDVPSLPTPDFSGLSLDDYLSPYPVLPILTGKGCYFNRCKFCDIPYINHVSRKAYRVRGAEKVVADMHELHRRHGASHFVITDEALSPTLLGDLTKAFDARPGDFAMTGYARPEQGFTAEACRRFAAFGLRKLFFGLESGSQATLDHMDKAVRIAEVPQILANCRAAGIDFHLFSIIGLPQETASEARKTLDFLLDNKSVINSPGTSFDVHPFGLERRTDYFSNRSQYEIDVHPESLRDDFIIGFDGEAWENAGGLSAAEARRLIATDMIPSLREGFRDWHASPDPLWPPQEEYSLLYSTRYRQSHFDWRTSLPENEDEPFAFVPSSTNFGARTLDEVQVETLEFSIRLPAPLVRIIESGETLSLRQHLHGWPEPPPIREIRDYIQALVSLGLLAIRQPAEHQAEVSA